MSLSSLKISHKLVLGFSVVCLMFAIAVGVTVYQTGLVADATKTMTEVRSAAAIAITEVSGKISQTRAGLRGYLLNPTPKAKEEAEHSLKELAASADAFDRIVPHLGEQSKSTWVQLKSALADFRAAEEKILAIAGKPEAFPATRLLDTEVMPRATKLFESISALITEEAKLMATPERKALLGTMADVRGFFSAAMSDLRLYLVSGNKELKQGFEGKWAKFQGAMSALAGQRSQLNEAQTPVFSDISNLNADLVRLTGQIFDLRDGTGWNVPMQILSQEAGPKAELIIEAVEGSLQANGQRTGGLQRLQVERMEEAEAEVMHGISLITTIQTVLLAIGLSIGGFIAYIITRSISGPVRSITRVMEAFNAGDLAATVPGGDRKDEIGEMAASVLKFQQSLQEAERMRADQAERQKVAAKIAMENARIKVALDNCSTNVMVADAEHNIVYMNDAVLAMMRSVESDVRKELPQFDSARLLGINIDSFHKNPAHQRRMLETLSSTYKTQIRIGGRTFSLIANPVLDDDGKRLGSVVEWRDVTAELAVEEEIDKVVGAASVGDFRERINLDGKQGFMRTLAESMNRICSTTADALGEVNGTLQALAGGDLTRRVAGEYAGMFQELKDNLNATSERLAEIVSGVGAGANEVASAANEIADGTNDLSRRTEQQASSLEETAASMEEMSSTIKQNAENATEANRLAATASSVASTGGDVVGKAVTAMSRIEESSQKISDIIGVIDEIAFQTNLLALNAAVEAARAGDAGKGFAVVASEVRSLAQRSSAAAKDIKTLIVESGSQVKDGVRLVHDAGSSLREIVASIKSVADIIAEIASASREQATGVEEINKAVAQMDEMTQQNSALVEENAAACRMLQEQAQGMQEKMAMFVVDGLAPKGRPASADRPGAAPGKAGAPGRKLKSPARKAAGGGAGAMQAALQANFDGDADWKEF